MIITKTSHPELWGVIPNLPDQVDIDNKKYNHFREEADRIYPHLNHREREIAALHLAHTHIGYHDKPTPEISTEIAAGIRAGIAAERHRPVDKTHTKLLIGIAIALGLIFLALLVPRAHGASMPHVVWYLNARGELLPIPQQITNPGENFDASGNLLVNCAVGCSGGGGGGGTSSTFGAAFPATGTAIGVSDGTNMVALKLGQQLAAASLPIVLTASQLTTLTPLSTVAVTQSTSPWVVSLSSTTVSCATVCQVGPTTSANTLSNQFFTQLSDGTHGNTFMSTTTSSKWGADVNILSILGTAPTTAGFLDIKVASGQTIAVTNTGTFATQSAVTAASGAYASGSISDGAEVTIGAKADAKNAATDTTAVSVVSILKEISSLEQAPASRAVTNVGTFATQSAITAASGSIASGAIASGAIASGALASGSISSGACVSGCIADGGLVTLGAKADAKSTATDTTAITAMQVLKEISFMAQTPAALPANQSANIAQIGGTSVVADPCQSTAKVYTPINQAAAGPTTLVAGTSAKKTYICSMLIVTATAQNVNLVEGTGTNCSSVTSGVLGGTTAATGPNLAANGGFTHGDGTGGIAATATNADNLCIIVSGTGQVSGVMSTVQQ